MNLREKSLNEFGGLSPELQRAAEFSTAKCQSAGGCYQCAPSRRKPGKTGDALLRLAQRLGYHGWSRAEK